MSLALRPGTLVRRAASSAWHRHAGVARMACSPSAAGPARGHDARGIHRVRKIRRVSASSADVATAALRDLGCDNYNEGYNPTTAVMGADGVVRTPEELGDEPDVGAVRAIAGYGSAMPSLAE